MTGRPLTYRSDGWSPVADLEQIIEDGEVVNFVLQSSNRADDVTPKWLDAKEVGKAQLIYQPVRGGRLPKLLFKKAASDEDARAELLHAFDHEWDEALVDVKTETGRRRFVFGGDNKEWFSWDVTDEVGGPGQPSSAALVKAALRLLDDHGLRSGGRSGESS